LFFMWRASHRKIMLYFGALLHVANISQEDNALFRRFSSCGKHLTGRSCFISAIFFICQASHIMLLLYYSFLLHVANALHEEKTLFQESSLCGERLTPEGGLSLLLYKRGSSSVYLYFF